MDPLEGPGPATELLAVVGVDDELRASVLALAQLADRLAHIAEGDERPQTAVAGEHDEREALVLGDERLAEVFATQAGLKEVLFVEHRVGDAGLGEQ